MKKREVLVLYSADRSDACSRTLREDVGKAFAGKDFVVTPRKFAPAPRTDAFSGTPGANSVGQGVCRDKKRMVFFAGARRTSRTSSTPSTAPAARPSPSSSAVTAWSASAPARPGAPPSTA